MSLTIENWVIIGMVGITGLIICIYLVSNGNIVATLINLIITIAICIGGVYGLNWYHTSTASGVRNYKDFQSELSNGINRELVITAEDGREIFRYKGKFDLDMDNDGNYLRFETQNGQRYTIEYGIQDTVLVIEEEK